MVRQKTNESIIALVTMAMIAFVSRSALSASISDALPALGKTARTLPKNSGELLLHLYTALAIESFLDKDPLILSEIVQQLPRAPVTTPIVLGLFHTLASPTAKATEKYLLSKTFGGVVRFGENSSRTAGAAAGLAVGCLGTRLLFELVSGDAVKYVNSAEERARLGAHVAGLGVGFGASTATAYGANGLLAVLGYSNPYTAIAVTTVSGVVFFVTSDRFEKWASGELVYGIRKNELNEIIGHAPSILSRSYLDSLDKTRPWKGVMTTNLRQMREAYAALRSQIMDNVMNREKKYLREMVNIRKDTFRKIMHAEWLRDGAEQSSADYKANVFDWMGSNIMTLDQSISVVIDRSLYPPIMNTKIAEVERESRARIRNVNQWYLNGRDQRYEHLLHDSRFVMSYHDQMGILLRLLSEYLDSEDRPTLSDLETMLPGADREDAARFLEVTEDLSSRLISGLFQKNPAWRDRVLMILADLNFLAREYSWHSERTYFDTLIGKSEELFHGFLEGKDLAELVTETAGPKRYGGLTLF